MNSTISVEQAAKENVLTTEELGVEELPKYTVISCKCIKCALHFKIYTWHPQKWQRKIRATITLGAHCPECANKGAYILSWVERQGWIFQECPEKSATDRDYLRSARKQMEKAGVETR